MTSGPTSLWSGGTYWLTAKTFVLFVVVAGSPENLVAVENSGPSKVLPEGVRVLILKTCVGFVSWRAHSP